MPAGAPFATLTESMGHCRRALRTGAIAGGFHLISLRSLRRDPLAWGIVAFDDTALNRAAEALEPVLAFGNLAASEYAIENGWICSQRTVILRVALDNLARFCCPRGDRRHFFGKVLGVCPARRLARQPAARRRRPSLIRRLRPSR